MQVIALGRKLTQKDELKKLNWRSDITEKLSVVQTPTMMQRETCRDGGRRKRRELKNLKKPPRKRKRKKVSDEIKYLHAPTASRLPLLCSVVLLSSHSEVNSTLPAVMVVAILQKRRRRARRPRRISRTPSPRNWSQTS